MLENDLVYRRSAKVNWDPVENTVLANEQVVDGRGWRSGAVVEQRELEQWFFRITKYGDDLLAALDTLDRWPDKVRTMQGNWIGKSQGAKIWWEIASAPESLSREKDAQGRNHATDPIEVYTTRPDTLFGAAFVALAPDHPLTKQIAKSRPDVAKFMADCAARGTSEADIEKAEKVGIDLGIRVKHPFDASQLGAARLGGELRTLDLRLRRFSARPPATSATSSSRRSTACPSSRWSCRPAPIPKPTPYAAKLMRATARSTIRTSSTASPRSRRSPSRSRRC
jgi:hypothetical protein